MISIVKATEDNAQLLSEIAKQTFLESHGNCAEPKDVAGYVNEKLSLDIFKQELAEKENIYHILYYNSVAAGYSKVILNEPYTNSEITGITKLERLYILKDFYDLKLGLQLFKFNINLAKENHQEGIWLYVWIENQRAVSFYKKCGFAVIGSYDFKISETHSNPNHRMFLKL
jgi:ribosomal protein S18 acetylase RimI-like enzyme